MELSERGKALRKALPLLLAATCSTDGDELPLDYHQVKASYLFNLLRFIGWPEDVCPAGGRLNLAICGAYSLDAYYALHGAQVGRRIVVVKRLKERDVVAGRSDKCHVLVIGGEVPLVSVPIARGLLTVGETDGFTACGGIINLTLIDGRVRFQLNEEMARACGLLVDAKILNVRIR